MAFQGYNETLDDTNRLSTSLSVTAASTPTVGAGTAWIDLGAVAPAFNVNTSSTAPFGRFAVVVDWTTCKVSAGDEDYYVELQGSDASSFSTAYRLGVLRLGNGNLIGYPSSSADTPPNSRKVFYCDNVVFTSATDGGNAQPLRYVRLLVTAFGTSPSITITGAWLTAL